MRKSLFLELRHDLLVDDLHGFLDGGLVGRGDLERDGAVALEMADLRKPGGLVHGSERGNLDGLPDRCRQEGIVEFFGGCHLGIGHLENQVDLLLPSCLKSPISRPSMRTSRACTELFCRTCRPTGACRGGERSSPRGTALEGRDRAGLGVGNLLPINAHRGPCRGDDVVQVRPAEVHADRASSPMPVVKMLAWLVITKTPGIFGDFLLAQGDQFGGPLLDARTRLRRSSPAGRPM